MTFYGIEAGATVQLSLNTYKLVVEYSRVKKEQFIVWSKKTDTVATVKEMIKKVTKFVPERQTLRRVEFGAKLEDTQKMAPLIEIDSTIYLSIDEFQIDVEYKNRKYPIWVKDTEPVGILKKKLMIACGPKPPKSINSGMQTLEYGTVGVLDDRKLMNDYGIGAGATVSYSIGTFTIQVDYQNKKGNRYHKFIWVRESDTVKTLKQKIEIKLGFKPIIQSLTYSSHKQKQYPLHFDDTKTLEDHAIKDGGIIQLGFSEFEICVLFNGGKELRVLVKTVETVKDLKEKVKEWVGIPPKKQKISIGKGGEANHRVLQDSEDMFGIDKAGYVVHVSGDVAAQFQIFVQYKNERKAINVYGTDMVENLKEKINKEIGIVPERQTLQTVLEDGKQIENFGIRPDSTIYLSEL